MTKVLLILVLGGAYGGPAIERFDSMKSCKDASAVIEKYFNDAGFFKTAKTYCIEVPK